MPADVVRLAFLQAVHPRGKAKSPDMTVIRRYPFGELRVALGDGLATFLQHKQVFDSFTSEWVSGEGRPVILLAFADSDAGLEVFNATRAPETRRILDGDGTVRGSAVLGNGMVRWNAKTRTLSLICPGEFVIKKAYSARVRKWTTDNIDWLQRFIEEHLASHLSSDVRSDAPTAVPHPGEGPMNTVPERAQVPHAVAPENREAPAGGYRVIVEELEGMIGRSPGNKQVASNRRQRSARARAAVILRSGSRCENPGCASPAFREVTESGEAILEVDHVRDLALGGEDHPLNMVALCPNCHAVKTLGRNAESLREVLARVARERHGTAWKS